MMLQGGRAVNLGDWKAWIGHSQVAEDVITPRLVKSFHATLAPQLAEVGSEAPLGLHWCLAPEIVEAARLGRDGHPAKGEFLPPVPLPKRMAAGGALTLLSPLVSGDRVERRSTITSVEEKTGRSGPLCFVTICHDIATDRGLAIQETQSIVYREEVRNSAVTGGSEASSEPSQFSREAAIDPVLLFRYSALTFNGHRIHYDAPYAAEGEHYPGLVVHGPLQATYLLNFAAEIGKRSPRKFSFRALHPAAGVTKIHLKARARPGEAATLWIEDPAGRVTMKAEAEW
jgi:3-methylfumaryl-CoA hydratase